jgi:hypothetical protein
MSKIEVKLTGERGPLGVELIGRLPINIHGTMRQLPTRAELIEAAKTHAKLAYGFEAILLHLYGAWDRIEELEAKIKQGAQNGTS